MAVLSLTKTQHETKRTFLGQQFFFHQAVKSSIRPLGIDAADFLERRRARETKGVLGGGLWYLKYCVFGV